MDPVVENGITILLEVTTMAKVFKSGHIYYYINIENGEEIMPFLTTGWIHLSKHFILTGKLLSLKV